jgi:hypothetical protein
MRSTLIDDLLAHGESITGLVHAPTEINVDKVQALFQHPLSQRWEHPSHKEIAFGVHVLERRRDEDADSDKRRHVPGFP